jgi:hypothetical protein
LFKKINLLIICAIILRVFFAAFFYHPDIKSQHFHGTLLGKGITNIYNYLDEHRRELPYTDTFNYPPLTYYFLGSYNLLAISVAGPSLVDWLWDWGPHAQQNPQIYFYLLLLKLPYLAADIGVLWLLLKITKGENIQKRLVYIWLFNPISLYAIYMIGQFDILPTLLTVCCLAAFLHKRYHLSGLFLGLGAAMKTYPLLLYPFIALSMPNITIVLSTAVVTGIFYLLPGFPFINSLAFRVSVFQSGLSKRIIATPWYGLLYLISLFVKKFRSGDLIFWFFVVTSGIVMFINFNPQWVVWMLPFFAILVSRHPKLLYPGIAFIILYFIRVILIPDQYMLVGMYVPTISFTTSIPALSTILPQADLVTKVSQVLLSCSGIFLIIQAYRYEKSLV